MLTFKTGNLLDSDAEALVNTVNTVGVMGKGIALMFKEKFPENFKKYAVACKDGKVTTGTMFVTATGKMFGPKWIINFPTKQHWRNPSKMEWVEEGLHDLRRVIEREHITSVAVPPLGSGNGGLEWREVRQRIERSLADMADISVVIYEPNSEYQNVAKTEGVEVLTPARALVVALVRNYGVLGFECTLLEIQKLAWFLKRSIERLGMPDPLNLKFEANIYGPYTKQLRHLLNALDGSYLHCNKRLSDAGPLDVVSFEQAKIEAFEQYLNSDECRPYYRALKETAQLIEGFESPLGMEALATIDWMLVHMGCSLSLDSLKLALNQWPGGKSAARRKLKLFSDSLMKCALDQLAPWHTVPTTA